jgi:hypothetical protein
MAAEPVSPEVAPTIVARSPRGELVVEQAPDQLERDVLEGERRAVEQLEQPEVVAVGLPSGDVTGQISGGSNVA